MKEKFEQFNETKPIVNFYIILSLSYFYYNFLLIHLE